MAVFVAASAFANALGASSILAVSNRTHTINADAWYQRRRLVSDYDAFWEERGGIPVEYGYKIPLSLESRAQKAARNVQRHRVVGLVTDLFESEP